MALKKQEHLDTIAMMKKSKVKYTYQGEKLNVKEIYSRNSKRRERSCYLLSVSVDVEKDGESIPAKLVYVWNKGNRKDYLALISTDTQLSEEEIIHIYWEAVGYRSLFQSLQIIPEPCGRIQGHIL